MKQYVLVNAAAWENKICTLLFASDDPTVVMQQKDVLSAAMNQRLEMLDSYHSKIPVTSKPLFKTVHEIDQWLRKNERKNRPGPKA